VKVTIVGVGALGSHLVQFLRNEKVTLKVIDFDRVEMRNVASQFHPKQSVGKKKVEGLYQTMKFLYGRDISKIGNKLTADNVEQILSDADLLIDCLDNGEARKLVQDFAKVNDVPCIHGALAADGGFGRVVWTEHFIIDEASAGTATCENGEFLPFIAITSAYIAYAAQLFLRDGRKVGFSISPRGIERI